MRKMGFATEVANTYYLFATSVANTYYLFATEVAKPKQFSSYKGKIKKLSFNLCGVELYVSFSNPIKNFFV
jgi:hypothetical protein